MSPASRLLAHRRALVAFGTVGTAGYLVDLHVFNLLRYAGDPGLLEHKPLTAKAMSLVAATAVT